MDKIIEDLKKIFYENFDVIKTDTTFNEKIDLFDNGYLDSFTALELRTKIEQMFSIKFDQKDLLTCPLNSLLEIAKFINTKKNL